MFSIQRLVDIFFAVPAKWAIGGVFLLTCTEASLFFGFVIPGEIAVVLGGVLASRETVSIYAVIAAAVGGAVVGDTIGFLIGRRWGSVILHRFFPRRWPPVGAWLDRRGAPAVFFGRSTAFLRAVVPTAAGAARMAPLRFLVWNVAGGIVWGTTFSLLGYFAGEGYEAAMRWAGRGSLALATLVAGLALFFVAKHVLIRRLGEVPPEEDAEEPRLSVP